MQRVWWPSGWQWLPVVLGLWLLYEVLRALVVGAIKRRYEAHVDKFLREHDIPVDGFRHAHRVVVKERVLSDAGLAAAIEARAKEEGRTPHEVRAQVRGWLDEIVPQFNLLAYYKVGYALGRTAAYTFYNVHLDKQSLAAAQAQVPEGAAVVYVSNHRSNADFVVTGFMLSRSVQISYAVGEWARVWPLESLFKAFGSYFVRRGEKDPLYHRTLEAYLQLITKQGVTQAMFPEGGLTRDGALRPAKVGLLDSMARAKLDPSFDKPLVFVPVGINFDRVIEDENMVAEAARIAAGESPRPPRRGVARKAWRLITLVGKGLWTVPVNTVRFLTKRVKKHGVAAIHFGTPIVFDDWYAQQTPFLDEPDRHKRWEAMQPFADGLLTAIGQNIPATPATLVCHAIASIGQERMAEGVDRGTVLLALKESRSMGRPMAVGDPYQARTGGREVDAISDAVDAADELEAILERALDVLAPRGIVTAEGLVKAPRWDLVAYYANSLTGSMGSAVEAPVAMAA